MNNEFTKINNGKEVRYVLEDGGATTTGAVATVEKPLGELQRRTKPPETRNPVAKNASAAIGGGAAGAHKDKKKNASVPRKEKHKKSFMESEANVSDRELDTIDPQDQGEEEGSFVKNQIHTMLRVLTHLEHAIGDEEDLPEWVQMKLSQAQQSVVGVMDYMISEKEREVERQTGGHSLMKEQGVAEGSLNELSSGLLRQAAELAKTKRDQAMDPKLHKALGGGYMNPLATHYDDVSKKIDDRAAQVQRKETIQNIASKIASPAVMRKMGITKEGVAEGDAYIESLTTMLERSVSQAQHNLMVGVANNPQFAQKVKVKQRVGQEFAQADQGHDISALPIRVPKKK